MDRLPQHRDDDVGGAVGESAIDDQLVPLNAEMAARVTYQGIVERIAVGIDAADFCHEGANRRITVDELVADRNWLGALFGVSATDMVRSENFRNSIPSQSIGPFKE